MLKSYIEYWDDSRDNSVKVIEAVVGRDRMVGVICAYHHQMYSS